MNCGQSKIPKQLPLWTSPSDKPLSTDRRRNDEPVPLWVRMSSRTDRRCCECGRNLAIEPAIKESQGLLCFPCRYQADKSGQECRFIHSESYRKDCERYRTECEHYQAECERYLPEYENKVSPARVSVVPVKQGER
jgi:hypothetical protein